MRLDVYLSTNGLCDSRNIAQSYIENGKVTVDGVTVTKASYSVLENADVKVDKTEFNYVARSAQKLLTAADAFSLDFSDKVAVDLGSSTGGFCQVMLERDIKKVYAVDIGTAQLHSKIRSDDRVVVMENTNARYITPDDFETEIDVVTCDLSFISVKYIFQSTYDILKENGEFICLIKPQFEVGKRFVGKNGVVKDKRAVIMCINEIIEYAIHIGFSAYDISFSGLEGESGNREFFIYFKKDSQMLKLDPIKISNVVSGSK